MCIRVCKSLRISVALRIPDFSSDRFYVPCLQFCSHFHRLNLPPVSRTDSME